MATKESVLRTQFFEYLFGEQKGYICIATGTPTDGKKDKFDQSFFRWPNDKEEVTLFIEGAKNKNIWYGINLLDSPERIKANCLPTDLIWADLDTCNPEIVEPKPQLVIETSTDRFQAIWRVDDKMQPELAEEYSRRIYNKYKTHGVDSGWALTKLLRVPFTRNFKYGSMPKVRLLRADEDVINVSLFENLVIEELAESEDTELPDLTELPGAEFVIYEYRFALSKTKFKSLFFDEPTGDDWSAAIWQLINICLEVGMSREECLTVSASAKCNKYARDNRPIRHLWADVIKASTQNDAFNAIVGNLDEELIHFPELINDDERALIERSFIDDYVDWASAVTDASKEYHELSGCILLSAMLADKVHLSTQSNPRIVPNLWGLVLGESTLTRKTTAMDMAMSFVMEHDPALILATMDSSVEGMFTALSERSEKVSIYYRDEVTGFFDAMNSKSYLAGMDTTMTKLYDSPEILTRQLRKETISVRRPLFIFFGGGILERVHQVVDQQMFFSGFMPRFLVVSGEVDMNKVQWIGPPLHKNSTNPRDKIKNALGDMLEIYQATSVKSMLFGQEVTRTREIEVDMTDDAWAKMREIEQKLVLCANSSNLSLVALPTFTRLSTSLLKLAMLITCSRKEPNSDSIVTVELKDILHAASFIQRWSVYTVDLMSNVGKTTSERELQRVLSLIRDKPGLTRAELMRRFHMQALNAKITFQTLEERGQIIVKQSGRGYRIYPT